MSRTFDIVLIWILTLVLHVQGGGGSCSPARKAECEALWRTCQNGQCGDCLLEIEGECYDPSGRDDSILEKLENCDPTVDPECKRNLEDVSEQLLEQLESDKKKDSNGESTDSHIKKEANISQSGSKLEKNNGEHSEKENERSIDFGSKEPTSKNQPVKKHKDVSSDDVPDVYFLVIIVACTLSGVAGIVLSGYCWYKLHYSDEKASKSDYIPGVKRQSINKSTPSKNGDRKLDYKAEMYHYVHTKNQLAAMEKAKSDHLSSGAVSNDDEDEDENEDYTVYECPGLAPTGDMTVVNPLFSDQEISVSDEGRAQSSHSSPVSPSRSNPR